jgi:dGTPase
VIKHSTRYDHPELSNFAPEEQPALEAQIIDFADEIAYNNHDLDDGLSSGMLDLEAVRKLAVWRLAARSLGDGISLPRDRKYMVTTAIRAIINLLVSDLIETTRRGIEGLGIKGMDDVRKAPARIVGFSGEIGAANQELKDFLMGGLYQHYRVGRMSIKAQKVVMDLFTIYHQHPNALYESYHKRIKTDGLEQTISDYIAGMTDRYALEEHQKLTDPSFRV